jgi:hypothetical protein
MAIHGGLYAANAAAFAAIKGFLAGSASEPLPVV